MVPALRCLPFRINCSNVFGSWITMNVCVSDGLGRWSIYLIFYMINRITSCDWPATMINKMTITNALCAPHHIQFIHSFILHVAQVATQIQINTSTVRTENQFFFNEKWHNNKTNTSEMKCKSNLTKKKQNVFFFCFSALHRWIDTSGIYV